MTKGLKDFTYLIAKDISKKRQLKKLKEKTKSTEETARNNIKLYNELKSNKDLNVTLEVLSNPIKIINLLKNDGISGFYKLFIAPISCILIHHSILPSKVKSKLEKEIQKSSKQLPLNSNVETTDKVQKPFRLVA